MSESLSGEISRAFKEMISLRFFQPSKIKDSVITLQDGVVNLNPNVPVVKKPAAGLNICYRLI